jgi:diacylglycerol kinase
MLASFSYAVSGILEFFLKERNARIHFTCAITAVLTGFMLHISNTEWIVIIIMIMSVMAAEMINTAIELLCDHVQPGLHEQVRIIKDIAAGAVLIASMASVAVAAIIFIPKFIA